MAKFLAHLWGAYAIPIALSGIHRLSYVVRHVSSVSTITTVPEIIKLLNPYFVQMVAPPTLFVK